MKAIIFTFLTIIIIMGCQSAMVRDEDLNSWQGRSTIELEKHPIFSALPREERDLNNGESIINFTQRKTISTGSSNCVGVSSGFGYHAPGGFALGSEFCNPTREIKENNCVHQFLVRNDKVVNYKVLGNECVTTCKNQPDPSKCKK